MFNSLSTVAFLVVYHHKRDMNEGGGIEPEELNKLSHLRDDIGNRAVPILSIYDSDYDTSGLPDWTDNEDWLIFHIHDGEVVPIKGETVVGSYFGTERADEDDLEIPFLNFYYQHASWPDVMGILPQIVADIRLLSVSLMKIASFQYYSQRSSLGYEPFVRSELEYIFGVCRSLYDHVQFIIAKTWEHIEPTGGDWNELSTSFSSVALHGEEPIDTDQLVEKYNIPIPLAVFYEEEAEIFMKIREYRDNIFHEGETPRRIIKSERGFRVRTQDRPYNQFTDSWNDERVDENGVAPLWPFVAYIIGHTISMINRARGAWAKQIQWPPEIAPGYRHFIRGRHIHQLRHVGDLKEDDPWGDVLIDEIAAAAKSSDSEPSP